MPEMTANSSAAMADWLRLWRLLQQSSQSTQRLLDTFSSPAEALAASAADWRRLGVSPEKSARLDFWKRGLNPELQREMNEGVAADLAWCEAPGNTLLTLHSENYPELLREITEPPPLLFLRGNASLLHLPQIAIVGSRHPSHTGRSDAAAFAAELASAGLVITSGMARGIDAAAHDGALTVGGKTIAVLGTGANTPYPRENIGLYERILSEGSLVVSEFRPGTPPLSPHFPRRNRIISGLSLGVLVVEAAPESGSLITARLAGEQGRLVWALPGSRHHVQAQGCLRLIRDGVTAITDSQQILGDLPPMIGFMRERLADSAPRTQKPQGDIEPDALMVLEALGHERRHADWLIAATGKPPAMVLRSLAALEMAGLVTTVPGGYERLV
jgi:DNA processing protein